MLAMIAQVSILGLRYTPVVIWPRTLLYVYFPKQRLLLEANARHPRKTWPGTRLPWWCIFGAYVLFWRISWVSWWSWSSYLKLSSRCSLTVWGSTLAQLVLTGCTHTHIDTIHVVHHDLAGSTFTHRLVSRSLPFTGVTSPSAEQQTGNRYDLLMRIHGPWTSRRAA